MRIQRRRKSTRLREKSVTKEVHNNWEISYGDMITLLLGFFILFFNIKTDRVNMKLLVQKLEKKFNKATGESVKTGFQQKNVSTKNLLSSPSLQKYKLHTNLQGDKLLIEFPGVSFFDEGKVELTQEGKNTLAEFASTLDKAVGSVRFIIRGYTDNTPPQGGRYKDNLELSAWRSLSAIRYLNKKGLDLKYMRIGGYGESDLGDRRLPASERSLDRKIVIVVEPLDSVERNHENLNKVANAEEAKAKLKDKGAHSFHHPVLDFIEEPSIEVWIKEELLVYERYEKMNHTIKGTDRLPANKPSYPTFLKSEQEQFDAWINGRIKNTYLYKKLNPYYSNEKKKDNRGTP
jgi:chemotaxis protein MotB